MSFQVFVNGNVHLPEDGLTYENFESTMREWLVDCGADGLGLDSAEIASAVTKRERVGPTTIGANAAVPHDKSTFDELDSAFVFACRLDRPIDWPLLSTETSHVHFNKVKLVQAVFIVVCPKAKPQSHGVVMEFISRYLRQYPRSSPPPPFESPADFVASLSEWSRQTAGERMFQGAQVLPVTRGKIHRAKIVLSPGFDGLQSGPVAALGAALQGLDAMVYFARDGRFVVIDRALLPLSMMYAFAGLGLSAGTSFELVCSGPSGQQAFQRLREVFENRSLFADTAIQDQSDG